MEYSTEFLSANRLTNLDGIEAKIVSRLIGSKTHYAEDIWRLLKYGTETALYQPPLTEDEKRALVFDGTNGAPDATTSARVFLAPFVDDAWKVQCASLYIYVSDVYPLDRTRAEVTVNVEVVVHSQVSLVNGNGDPTLNPDANPADTNEDGEMVVVLKNRATCLVKDIIAELNGIYLDGVGYMFLQPGEKKSGKVEHTLWNVRSFYGHRITWMLEMSGVSDSPDVGY